jgi:hypothetical protein
MALIGETEKFITASAKRFRATEFREGKLSFSIEGVPGEMITVKVFADHEPVPIITSQLPGQTTTSDAVNHNGVYDIIILLNEDGCAALQLQ